MKLHRLLPAVLTIVVATLAQAADYPDKPVRIVVAYAPGGMVDVMARKLAQKLADQTKGVFVVENKPGATGTIGTQQVVRAAPDGYTLLAIDNTFSILPFVFRKLPWDQEMPLMPVSPTAFIPVMLLVKADAPFKDLAGLVAYAKANPEKLTYGTGGSGSAPHFSTEAFQQASGIRLTHVPYKGAGEAMTGLISGQVDLVMLSTPSAASQLKAGRVRALAASGNGRLAAYPNVPTFDEAGLPSYSVINWTGIAVPLGTPKEITARLQAEMQKALQSADMKEFLAGMSAEPGGQSPDAFARLIRDETAKWAEVAQRATIEKQ